MYELHSPIDVIYYSSVGAVNILINSIHCSSHRVCVHLFDEQVRVLAFAQMR